MKTTVAHQRGGKSAPLAPHANESSPVVREALASSAEPLSVESRRFMENRFGHDFSRIGVRAEAGSERAAEEEAEGISALVASAPARARTQPALDFAETQIHAGPLAASSARSLHARAYTVGSHIVFAPGEYRPETAGGRQLLAHELAHTLQQRASGRLCLQKQEEETPTASAETAISVLPFPKGSNVALSRLFPDELFRFAPNKITGWIKGVQNQQFTVIEATADRVQATAPSVARSTDVPGSTRGTIAAVTISLERIGSGRFQITIHSGTRLLTSQEARATRDASGATVLSPVAAKPTAVPSTGKAASSADEFARSKGAAQLGLEGPSTTAQQKEAFDAVTKPSRSPDETKALQAEVDKNKVAAPAGAAPAEESKIDKELEDKLTKMAEAVGEAVTEKSEVKAIVDQLSAEAEKQWDALPTGAVAAVITMGLTLTGGLLPGLAATDTEPPIKKSPRVLIPLFKLLKGKPKDGEPVDKANEMKLYAQVTWKGPLDHPKEAAITLTFTKGSLEIAGGLKSTPTDPTQPVSPENSGAIEGSLSVTVPLGKDAPKKKEPTSAEKVAADTERLETEQRSRNHKFPAGSPEAKEAEMREKAEKQVLKPFEFSGTTSLEAGEFNSPRLLQSFDATGGPGKTPWNLDQLTKAIGVGLAASRGATLQIVAVFEPGAAQTVEERLASGQRRDALVASLDVTKQALEQWIPTLKSRIRTSVQLKGTGRTFGVAGNIADQLGAREISVIFIPGSGAK
jgi:Domain of unknown function (DUF4157)